MMRFIVPVYFIECPIADKSVSGIDVFQIVNILNNKPPEWSYEICYHKNDNDQAEDFVVVYKNKLSLDSISPRRFIEVAFYHSLDAAYIKDGYHLRETRKSDHSRIHGIFKQKIKRKRCQEVDEHPTALGIPYSNFLNISNFGESFLIFILHKAVKDQVQSEKECDNIIQDLKESMGLHIEGDIKYGCGTRISNNHQNTCVKNGFPRAVQRNAKIIYIK